MSYLEGVIGVRSLPMVWITLRPHTQSPAQIPTPPYRSNHIGVGAVDTTEPLSYTSQRATSGPIALLVTKMLKINDLNNHTYSISSTEENNPSLPDIIPSMSKGSKTGCEDLQKLEQQ